MSRIMLSRVLLWLALFVLVVGGAGLYRFYLTAPELRFPASEARWQLVPLAVLLLLVVSLLVRPADPNGPSAERPPR